MAITLNHTIVPAHDKTRAANFLTQILGLGSIVSHGPFDVVQVNPSLAFDFAEREHFEPHHYAFQVGDDEFDAIFERVRRAGVVYSSDPHQQIVGQISHRDGRRGFYFRDPEGHILEVMT